MSAAEIIELIKELPESEQQEVVEFVRENFPTNGIRYATSNEAIDALRKVMVEYDPLFKKLAQ